MKKWRMTLLALGTSTALVLAGIWLNARFPVLQSGDTLSAKNSQCGVLLQDWEAAGENRWTLRFTTQEQAAELVLFFGQSGALPVDVYPLGAQLSKNYVSAAWRLRPLAAGEAVVLTVTCAEQPNAWLVPFDTLATLVAMRIILQWISLSAMGIMILFSLALYWYKRESYLLYFLTYAAVMLAWGSIIYMFPDNRSTPLITAASRLCFSLMLLSGIWVSYGLTGRRRPAWLPERRQGLPFALAASALFCLLQYILAGWPRLVLICGSMLVCLYILLDACAAGLPGAWLLLIGAAVTSGLRPLVVFPGMNVSFYPESLFMYMVRGARIYDLPFTLGCMLFICRQFAVQFDRTEQLARELDARVAERTRELTEQQEARKSMMLNIFHDLRSPLFVMKNSLEAVAASPELLPKMLPVLQERTAFMHGLTEDLFLAAKLEQNQILLNEDRVELCGEALQVCAALQTEAEKKGVALTVNCPAPLWVWGDSFRLRQVVQNLVTNAIYYTPSGGRVLVTAEAKDGQALLHVADTGCGIAPEDQTAVFRRYFHTTAQNKHDSSGLGLTIALDLVRLHHGDIHLESQVGKGSTFTVILPLLPTEEAE